MARVPIATNEYYHVFNRGVDKRKIFSVTEDSFRFFISMQAFNSTTPIHSLFELSSNDKSKFLVRSSSVEPLVEIIAYCLNPNHYHLLLRQLVDGGVSEYMKRLGGGYTLYFNEKNKRSGALFQGKFKYTHIESNEQLLHVSAYVNLNDRGHRITGKDTKLVLSSWSEYCGNPGICTKESIVEQFPSMNEYRKFAESSLEETLRRKDAQKELHHEFF